MNATQVNLMAPSPPNPGAFSLNRREINVSGCNSHTNRGLNKSGGWKAVMGTFTSAQRAMVPEEGRIMLQASAYKKFPLLCCHCYAAVARGLGRRTCGTGHGNVHGDPVGYQQGDLKAKTCFSL